MIDDMVAALKKGQRDVIVRRNIVKNLLDRSGDKKKYLESSTKNSCATAKSNVGDLTGSISAAKAKIEALDTQSKGLIEKKAQTEAD